MEDRKELRKDLDRLEARIDQLMGLLFVGGVLVAVILGLGAK